MQRFVIFAGGSRGDVQPYLALALALERAGRQVTLVTTAALPPLAGPTDVQVVSVAADDAALLAAAAQAVERGNLAAALRITGAGARRVALASARAAQPFTRHADQIIAGFGGLFSAELLAAESGSRFVPAFLMPISTTATRPSLLLDGMPLPRALNRLTHRLTQQMLWLTLFRDSDQLVRRTLFNRPPISAAGRRAIFDGGIPLLYGFSPSVVAPAADWPATIQVSGAWHLPPDCEVPLSDELERFLAAGPPPLVIGFGSMVTRDAAAAAQIVTAALRRHGRRGILLSGWGGLRADALRDDVLLVPQAAHRLLMPRAAAVVHHAGAGTTMAGLTAGVPNLAVPFFGDQPFWAARIAALGAGPAPLPRRKLTLERLTAAFDRLLNDPDIAVRAAQLGRRMQAEDGAGTALRFLLAAERGPLPGG